ncbi:MAG: hypothetical protein QOI02_1374, partial [Actinomycetota bacterium]|nr:hypothetical protein [Actinomycetota bacterium]
AGPQPGWTPPPRPGLIPLRPLGLGDILSASFATLRRNPRPTFGTALVINGITGTITFLAIGAITISTLGRVYSAGSADTTDINLGGILLEVTVALVTSIFSLIGDAILQGIISLEVARGSVGEKLTFRGLWRLARGRLWPLIGWSLLIAVVLLVWLAVVGGIVALLVVPGGTAAVVSGVLVGLLLLGGTIVLFVWFSTKLSFVPSALLIERLTLRHAIRRSWSLVRGQFWRIFGIQLLVSVMVSVAAGVVTSPVAFAAGLLQTLGNPNNDPSAAVSLAAISQGATTIVGIFVGAITSIIVSATAALLYIDRRMRTEGLDLQLTRFVEARAAGATDVPDPYLQGQDEPVGPTWA